MVMTDVSVRGVKQVLSPVSGAVRDVLTASRRLDSIEDKTICFWHDSTPEADVIFPVVRDHLLANGAAEVLLARQPAPASPPQEFNLALARRSDAAILGVAW